MNMGKNLKLGVKCIITFLMVGILPFAWIGISSLVKSSWALEKQAFSQLEAVQKIKKNQIQDLFTIFQGQLEVTKNNPFFKNRLLDFNDVYEEADNTVDSEDWRGLASKWDEAFIQMCADFGWHDFYLINPAGHIVYTMAKNSDLGQSLFQGPLASTSLGIAVAKLQDKKGEVSFSDFKPYAPTDNEPTAFMAARVTHQGGYARLYRFPDKS